MNKVYLQSIFLLVTLFFSISAQAQPLWRGTTTGMSLDEVLEIVKEARPVQDKEDSSKWVELARIDDFKLLGISFEVSFVFVDQKLAEVLLKPSKSLDYITSLSIFYKIRSALTIKYGGEVLTDNYTAKDLIDVKEKRALWLNDGTEIQLSLSYYKIDRDTLLMIDYNTYLSEESDKL